MFGTKKRVAQRIHGQVCTCKNNGLSEQGCVLRTQPCKFSNKGSAETKRMENVNNALHVCPSKRALCWACGCQVASGGGGGSCDLRGLLFEFIVLNSGDLGLL